MEERSYLTSILHLLIQTWKTDDVSQMGRIGTWIGLVSRHAENERFDVTELLKNMFDKNE